MVPANFLEQLIETRGDFEAFCRLVWPRKDGKPGLHAGQRRFTEHATKDVNLLIPGNSWGKTEYIKRYSLYLAFHKLDGYGAPETFEEWMKTPYKGLVCSYTYPIAEESFDRMKADADNLPTVGAIVKSTVNGQRTRVTLTNDSIIDWGSLDGAGKLVEAARRQFIFVDEVGHIPDISSTFDDILFPRTMGVGGRIYLFGTPKAHSDPYLLEVYEKGRTGQDPFYYSQPGSVFENEFWRQEERERVLANPRYVTGWQEAHDPGEPCDNLGCRNGFHPTLTLKGRQVVDGEFILAGGFFFNRHHTQRLFRWPEDDPENYPEVVWEGENHFHIAPIKGHMYYAAYDLGGNKPKARRKGSDPTTGFTIDCTTKPWKVVRYDFVEGGEMDWEQKYELMKKVYKDYTLPYLILDATGQVDSVQEALQTRGVEVEGIHFGGTTNKKFDMLRNLQICMEMEWSGTKGVLRCPPIPGLQYELDHYVIPDDEIAQDRIMALAMACFHIAQYELPAPSFGMTY